MQGEIMELETIEQIIRSSLRELKQNDYNLFELDSESEIIEYIPDKLELERKLHEVCINHRFAVYLENFIKQVDPSFCVDIEYNRYYKNEKVLKSDYYTGIVRPDIIIHKRSLNSLDQHLLIIEAKKDKTDEKDELKIKSFMSDPKYRYKYGARIRYNMLSDKRVEIYFHDGDNISKKQLLY